MQGAAQSRNGAPDGGREEMKAYLVGGGIASLAGAVYLIRDGHLSGKHIRIFEETDLTGGSLDAQGSPESGYIMRGGRMFLDSLGNACKKSA